MSKWIFIKYEFMCMFTGIYNNIVILYIHILLWHIDKLVRFTVEIYMLGLFVVNVNVVQLR